MSQRFSVTGARHARDVVDELLACEKSLEGSPAWREFDDESRLKWTVAAEGVPTDATLDVTAYPFGEFYPFTITLNFPPCIWRLEHGPGYLRHDNPLEEMSQFDRTVWGSHYHSWADNRRLTRPNSLPAELEWARPLPMQIRTFEQALRWFCNETRIHIRNDQVLDLPTKGFL